MSCVSSPTATDYTTITTYSTSTSFSQSVSTNQASVTTIVQQTCVATGTSSGSAMGCVSSTAVTQVSTIGGGTTTVQVPVVVTVPVTQTQPTKTLYATCPDGSTQTQQTSTTSQIITTSTTSVLVVTTPPPSVITQASSTTLADGNVVATTITTTSTLPPSSVYVASTITNPSATSTQSQSGSGTNVAPIVGGVVGGFVGLILIVSALWYFCRKRASWDDIFDREGPPDDESTFPIAVRRESDRNRLDLATEPKPYQYGLVGHVTPPPGSGSLSGTREPGAFHRPSFTTSMASSHSRNTSITPLLGAGSAPGNAAMSLPTGSMPVTAQPAQIQPSASATSQSSAGPRALSIVSSSSSAPLIDDRAGSPVSVIDRRVLQIINDAPLSPISVAPTSPAPTSRTPASPAAASSPPARHRKGASAPRPPTGVVQHTDAGQVPVVSEASSEPPPYSSV